MLAVAEGRPDDIDLRWSEQWAVCVVLALSLIHISAFWLPVVNMKICTPQLTN